MFQLLRSLRVQLAGIGICACVVGALFGVFRFFDYSLPMNSHDFRGAAEASVGDPSLALYDWSLQLYGNKRFAEAIEVATEAHNQLSKKTGNIPAERKDLAAKIQMTIGVCNEHQKQYRLAISAYEESLRFDPTNLAAKYNLERLKSKFPDIGGPGQPKEPGGGGQDKKKGV
jgi:tetratricopeptide (TPR) repeat protein